MPHLRRRHALGPLRSKLGYSPVVTLQGVRQCGKSTLAREFVPLLRKSSVYRTLDVPSVLHSALDRPESFLENLSDYAPVIIDEAQKAPVLFDAVKARVDVLRKPGQYLLLGSTEFSQGMRIREALTGRLSRLRLFPLLLSEACPLPLRDTGPFLLQREGRITRKVLLRFLQRGGMPAMFATRSDAEWNGQMQDWVSLTVERDALQIPTKRISPSILHRVIREIAVSPEPEAGRIARTLRLSSMTVKSHIEALKILFVVHEIPPHPMSTGKPRYYLCDPGVCGWLGGGFERQLETLFYLEQLAKLSYLRLEGKVQFSSFRSTKGSFVHGIWETRERLALLKLLPTERIDERELFILQSLRKKLAPRTVEAWCLAGAAHGERIAGVSTLPWEALA